MAITTSRGEFVGRDEILGEFVDGEFVGDAPWDLEEIVGKDEILGEVGKDEILGEFVGDEDRAGNEIGFNSHKRFI